jgi:hypothetical protein
MEPAKPVQLNSEGLFSPDEIFVAFISSGRSVFNRGVFVVIKKYCRKKHKTTIKHLTEAINVGS